MNPFADRAKAARARADRLAAPNAHDAGMAHAFPLGPGFGHGSQRSRERRLDAAISNAWAAIDAEKEARHLEHLAAAFERGEVDAHGRRLVTEAERTARAEAKRRHAAQRRAMPILNEPSAPIHMTAAEYAATRNTAIVASDGEKRRMVYRACALTPVYLTDRPVRLAEPAKEATR